MHQSPLPIIDKVINKQVLMCSAYGNAKEMGGEFRSSTGSSLSWSTSRNGNLFKIETTVTESATYICKIWNSKRHVEAMTVVTFFTCKKYSLFMPNVFLSS